MVIVIVGAGVVGFSLAEHLSRQGHLISVIDSNPDTCESVEGKLDVIVVAGSGSSPRSLEQAGIAKADMAIAVTPDDNTNLVVCNFAKQYGVPKRIARIKNPEYTSPESRIDLSDVGVTDVIEPEKEVVESILQYIELPGVTESANFMYGNIYLRGYRIRTDMPIAGKTLAEIRQLSGAARILIVLIIRDGKSILPTGPERIIEGDEIIAIMARESFPAFRALIGRPEFKHKKIIIAGETLTAIRLAGAVKPFAERVILVDPDEAHGRLAAAQLNGVEVLEGDCTDTDTLQDIGVKNASVFIGAGKETEDNLMACVMAKADGADAAYAVSYGERHVELFRLLGLDRIINPRIITAQSIMANILKVPIGALLRFRNVDIEVTRYVAEKNCRILNKPLSQFFDLFQRSVIIGSIFRDDNVIIPSGETVIRENDVVLVIYRPGAAANVEKLFHARHSFLSPTSAGECGHAAGDGGQKGFGA